MDRLGTSEDDLNKLRMSGTTNLDSTEEQEMLITSARDFLTTECPKTLVRGLEESEKGSSPELWERWKPLMDWLI
jgi:hypothetical protein